MIHQLLYMGSRKAPIGEGGAVVFDGDSIVDGFGLPDGTDYPTLVAADLPGTFDFWNEAVGGQTVETMISTAAVDVDTHLRPGARFSYATGRGNVVYLAGGTNDLSALGLAAGPTPDPVPLAATVLSRITQYRNERLAAGWQAVVIGTVLFRNGYDAWFNDAVELINAGILALANNNTTFVANFFEDPLLINPAEFPDGTHLDETQNAAIPPYVTPKVIQAMGL
jgi:hypothetical protein